MKMMPLILRVNRIKNLCLRVLEGIMSSIACKSVRGMKPKRENRRTLLSRSNSSILQMMCRIKTLNILII